MMQINKVWHEFSVHAFCEKGKLDVEQSQNKHSSVLLYSR